MTKFKKIRGGKRRLKAIKLWLDDNKEINLNYLLKYDNDYVKFRVDPWGRLIVNNIEFKQPKKAFKKEMINGLIEIYLSWKKQLDALNIPYYLKIWLFEKNIKKSQVVCAIQSKLHFYENTFGKPDDHAKQNIKFPFNETHPQINSFNWEMQLDDLYIEDNELGKPSDYHTYQDFLDHQKWFNHVVLKKYKRIYEHDEKRKLYVLDNDRVWIGSLE